ncbi:MAG: hypothetical protein M3R41_10445 [Pseudomonadota bacterium]|nr:hypothetical protein [Pseudomonadota bacterium]
MKMLVPLMLAAVAAAAPPAADGQRMGRHPEAQDAFEGTRRGQLMPLREIEGRVIPTMRGGQYLGFDFDGESSIYTLKFLRDGNVIWVYVDGRSGQIIRRSGR